jgi:hypothetical protein
MMNHKVSFFRLHKDAQDVFTFVIDGWRRFLLWPFATFAGTAGLGLEESWAPHLLYEVDYEAYRSQAVVLEAMPGDLLYWPAEWWHVGESNGERAISLAVGIIHEANPLRQLVNAADRVERRWRRRLASLPWGTDGAEPTVAAYIEWIESLLAGGELWEETRRSVLSWTTRCGLKRIPPPIQRSEPLDDAQWLAVTSPSAIAFEGGEDSLFCAIAGHEMVLRPGAPVRALLTLLAHGGVHQVGSLIDATLAECQTASDREQIRDLLKLIEANHGIEIIDTSVNYRTVVPPEYTD